MTEAERVESTAGKNPSCKNPKCEHFNSDIPENKMRWVVTNGGIVRGWRCYSCQDLDTGKYITDLPPAPPAKITMTKEQLLKMHNEGKKEDPEIMTQEPRNTTTIDIPVDLTELFGMTRPQVSEKLISRLNECIGKARLDLDLDGQENIFTLRNVLRQKPGGRPPKEAKE